MFYKTMIILIFLLKIPFICFASNEQSFEFMSSRSSIKVPIKTAHNLVIMPLQINNGPTLNFILDSGVNKTILTEPLLLNVLGLESDKLVYILGLGGEGFVEALHIEDVSIQIADDIEGRNLDLLVIHEDILSLSELFGFHIHGIIGYDLLKEFPIYINYINDFIRIYNESDYRIRRNSYKIPFELINDKPYIDAEITGHADTTITKPLLLDLGASHTLYLHHKYRFLNEGETMISYLGKGISGDMYGEEGRLKKIKLAENLVVEDAIVAYPEPGQMWIEQLDIQWEGLLGSSILSRFHLIIDYPSEQLVLRKNSSFNNPFNSNLSGIDLFAEGRHYRKFIISYVRPNSPAYEAGVKPRDRIVRINQKNAYEIRLQDVLNELSASPGTRISLTVSREVTYENGDNEKETKTEKHRLSFRLREDL